MINKVIYSDNILRIISMAGDLLFLDIRFTCCLIWYLIRYMVTSMGINTFSYLLVFLLFQISHRVIDSKTFISLHSLWSSKTPAKTQSRSIVKLYWKPWSLYFEFLPISLQLPHIHTKDGLSFLHVYSIFYIFHQIMTCFANDFQCLFDHGIISSWNLCIALAINHWLNYFETKPSICYLYCQTYVASTASRVFGQLCCIKQCCTDLLMIIYLRVCEVHLVIWMLRLI